MTPQQLIEKLREEAKNGVLSDFEAEDVKKICDAAEELYSRLLWISHETDLQHCLDEASESLKRANAICKGGEGE